MFTLFTWAIYYNSTKNLVENGAGFEQVVSKIVYVTKGGTLKLEANLPKTSFHHETYWDFSSLHSSAEEEAVRIIGSKKSSVEKTDARASLERNGTVLVLRNTTQNDSGVYHVRLRHAFSTIHEDFNVVVEGGLYSFVSWKVEDCELRWRSG